jgi:hypothetical protein
MRNESRPNRPLPRPTWREWAFIALAVAIGAVGVVLTRGFDQGWAYLLYLFALIMFYVVTSRVRLRRARAIRSRPPL